MDERLFASVSVAVADLTLDQLIVLNVIAALDSDPRGRSFNYEQVEHLFTEGGGLRMHEATKEALGRVVLQRVRDEGHNA